MQLQKLSGHTSHMSSRVEELNEAGRLKDGKKILE